MTAGNSRNASNSRNESNNRTAVIAGTPAKACTLAKVVKPLTAWMEANYSMDTINIKDDSSSSRDNQNIRDVNCSRTVRISRKKKQKTCSSNVSNIRTAAVAETHNSNIATVGWITAETEMPEQYGRHEVFMSFHGKSRKGVKLPFLSDTFKILLEHFKDPRHLVQLLVIRILIANAAMKFIAL
jgi:hypothetical protein